MTSNDSNQNTTADQQRGKTMAASPFKIDKLGNVTERETGRHLGYVHAAFQGGWMAVFSISALAEVHDYDGDIWDAPWCQRQPTTGQAPYVCDDFRSRSSAAQFLWATREYARDAFPPPDVGVREDVCDLFQLAAGAGKPRFVRLGGRWAAVGRRADLPPGGRATVYKRTGEPSEVELAEVLETRTAFGVPLATVLVAPRPRKPVQRHRAGDRRSWLTADCPGCGEGIGDMWDGFSCLECGCQRGGQR